MIEKRQALAAVKFIEAFLNGSGGDRDWDDFTSCPIRDRELDAIRRRAAAVDLPLDEDGRETLDELLVEIDHLLQVRY